MGFIWCLSTLDKLRSAITDAGYFGENLSNGKTNNGSATTVVEGDVPSFNNDAAASLALSTVPELMHVVQVETWDCGVACLLMVCSWLATTTTTSTPSRDQVDLQRKYLLHVLDTQSIWTIDLAYALDQMMRVQQQQQQQFGTSHGTTFCYDFHSTMLEANAEWKDYDYYAAAFDADEQRTRQRIEYLRQRQQEHQMNSSFRINHETKRQSIHWVVDRIRSTLTVAILLVDNSVLQACSQGNDHTSAMNHEESPSSISYSGHYLVVTGTCIDPDSRENGPIGGKDENDSLLLVVHDPNHIGVRYIPARHLELAWQAPGTDQDVIFIQKLQERQD